jgi:hypothetical protein
MRRLTIAATATFATVLLAVGAYKLVAPTGPEMPDGKGWGKSLKDKVWNFTHTRTQPEIKYHNLPPPPPPAALPPPGPTQYMKYALKNVTDAVGWKFDLTGTRVDNGLDSVIHFNSNCGIDSNSHAYDEDLADLSFTDDAIIVRERRSPVTGGEVVHSFTANKAQIVDLKNYFVLHTPIAENGPNHPHTPGQVKWAQEHPVVTLRQDLK